jgi:hypothetical protein
MFPANATSIAGKKRAASYVTMPVLSTYQEKIPARNATYAHAQDFAASDELLLAILEAFFPQPLNKQRTVGFHVF